MLTYVRTALGGKRSHFRNVLVLNILSEHHVERLESNTLIAYDHLVIRVNNVTLVLLCVRLLSRVFFASTCRRDL